MEIIYGSWIIFSYNEYYLLHALNINGAYFVTLIIINLYYRHSLYSKDSNGNAGV